jgi:hypothetical protein
MDGVHYGAAPLLLLVLVVIAARLRPPAWGGAERHRRAVRVLAALFASGSRG